MATLQKTIEGPSLSVWVDKDEDYFALQLDLYNIKRWCSDRNVNLNVEKCKCKIGGYEIMTWLVGSVGAPLGNSANPDIPVYS